MKRLLGVLLVIVAIGIALYLGGWLCFCIPIAEGINLIMSAAITAKAFAMILFKILICTPVIIIVAYLLAFAGITMITFN